MGSKQGGRRGFWRHFFAALAGTALLTSLAGCPKPAQPPVNTGPPPGNEPDPSIGAMTPEQMDEVQRTVRGGMTAITRCYTDELERRQDRKFKGKIVVKILIGTNSAAQKVDIGDDALNVPAINACLKKVIMDFEFPKLTKASWFTYPFQFSPAY